MDKEIWKPVPGYRRKYLVSSFGRIESAYRETKNGFIGRTGTMLKFSINKRGYYIVRLATRINGAMVKKTHKVHRLVALTFHENPHNKPQVNHKDLNPLNNRSDNLEWATAKENTNHAQVNGRRPMAKTA
jgi:hypothetical protein